MPLVSFLRRLSPLGRAAVGFAAASLVVFLLLQGNPRFTNASQPRGWMQPALAIQFARTVEEVDHILGDAPSADREVMRVKLYLDFVLIPSYVGLLVTWALMGMSKGGWRRMAGVGAIVCAAGAGGFDVVENLATLAIVDTPLRATTQPMIDLVTVTAQAKWTSAAVAIVLLVSRYVKPF
jgi:hypothetical protein